MDTVKVFDVNFAGGFAGEPSDSELSDDKEIIRFLEEKSRSSPLILSFVVLAEFRDGSGNTASPAEPIDFEEFLLGGGDFEFFGKLFDEFFGGNFSNDTLNESSLLLSPPSENFHKKKIIREIKTLCK